jgi:phosphoglycerate dehydrogenase-like enzyme
MELVLLGTLACEQEALVRRLVTSGPRITPVPDDAPDSVRRPALERARAAITMRYDATMPPAPRLGLLQVGGTGVDAIAFERLPPGCAVANAYGHEDAVAEYVVLAMLLWCTRLLEAERSFRAGSWALGGRTGGPLVEELGGKTVGLIGFGHIGRAVARRLAGFGVRLVVAARTPPEPGGDIAWAGGMDRVDRLLEESDFVVIACGLGPETLGLIDAARFGRMKPTGVLINVSRGAIVDEEALYRALRDGAIGGAVIDTWYRYPSPGDPAPRPSRFPFHELSNLIMTPHSSAWTTAMIDRRWRSIADNVDRFFTGQPLHHVVHRVPGRLEETGPPGRA